MAEAILKPFDPPGVAVPAGVPPRAVNGAPLRWEPVPDELRLPCSEAEPMPQNGRQGVPSKMLGLTLCIRPAGPKPTAKSLVWYDPAAGKFLPTRSEMEARAEAAEARAVRRRPNVLTLWHRVSIEVWRERRWRYASGGDSRAELPPLAT